VAQRRPPHQRHERQGEERGENQPAALRPFFALLRGGIAGDQRGEPGLLDGGKERRLIEVPRVETHRGALIGKVDQGRSHSRQGAQLFFQGLRTIGAVHAAHHERQLAIARISCRHRFDQSVHLPGTRERGGATPPVGPGAIQSI